VRDGLGRGDFEPIAELFVDPESTYVYEEGWQSWSPAGVYPAASTSPRPPDRLRQTMGWRSGKELPLHGFQGEGILAIVAVGEPVRVWYAPDPARDVASIRAEARKDRLIVSADRPVVELSTAGPLDHALATVGERLARGEIRSVPPGWCSWSCYFRWITETAVLENLRAAERLALPVEIVQVDDGYEAGIGDWLDDDSRFGSLRRTADIICSAAKVPGLWTAPFLVGERSALAAAHPEWLVEDADAGWNWGQRLRVLDVSHPDAASHLQSTYETLAAWGFSYFKLDFLYAGALEGRRHAHCSELDAYREGLRIVRDGVGHDAILLGCGAPLLPSIGLVDAMRIGPDVLPEPFGDPPVAPEPDLQDAIRLTRARAWTHARLWVADPDCVVARPEIDQREAWSAHVEALGGLAFSSDRLEALDERGLELTRRALKPSSTAPVVWSAIPHASASAGCEPD
jgi:alpha-galactosidase